MSLYIVRTTYNEEEFFSAIYADSPEVAALLKHKSNTRSGDVTGVTTSHVGGVIEPLAGSVISDIKVRRVPPKPTPELEVVFL